MRKRGVKRRIRTPGSLLRFTLCLSQALQYLRNVRLDIYPRHCHHVTLRAVVTCFKTPPFHPTVGRLIAPLADWLLAARARGSKVSLLET